MKKANKPVIIAGAQCVQNIDTVNEVAKVLKNMEIPTYLSSKARGLLSHDYNRQYRFDRGKCIRQADLVILLGVTVDFRLNYGMVFNKRSKIINVNNNKKDLYLN